MISRLVSRWVSCACMAAAASGAFADQGTAHGTMNSEIRPVTLVEEADVSLEQRMAVLEQRLAAAESYPAASSNCDPIASSRLSTNCVGTSSTYAGVELAILKANVGALGGSIGGLAGTVTSDFDYEVAPRIILGHERHDGLGLRMSYWQYDHTSGTSDLGVITGLELHALDLEVTNHVRFWGSDLWLSGGVRYAKMDQEYPVGGGALQFQSEGVGPTLAAKLSRDLGRTDWDLFASGRASFVLTDNEVNIVPLAQIEAKESVMRVWEARLGVSRAFHLRGGAVLTSEFAYEVQNWDSAAVAGIIGNDIALIGPAVRLELAF